MTAVRNPEQRARFIRAAAADLDIAPEIAERLLVLSEAARAYARGDGQVEPETLHALQDCLLDDDVSRHGWWVAAAEGEQLWRRLLESSPAPFDVGPAVLLAAGLARHGAADEALRTLIGVLRPGEFRRSAIELAAELSEDAGQPELAWRQVTRLGLADPDADWAALRCVLGCSRHRRCPRSGLSGVTHARWLRHRIARWSRRPWSSGEPGATDPPPHRTEPPPPDWSGVVGGYLATRSALLPAGEQELLRHWLQVRWAPVTVIESTRWEGTVLDEHGRRRHVGWETAAPPSVSVGDTMACRLLPTLLPAESLLVRTTVATQW
jgi:hypothetical protein